MNTFSFFSSSVICFILFQYNKHFYLANLSCIWILQVFFLYALICTWFRHNTIALDGQKDSLAHVIWSICYCCRHSLTALWWLSFYFWMDVIVSTISLLTIFCDKWHEDILNLIFSKEGHYQGCIAPKSSHFEGCPLLNALAFFHKWSLKEYFPTASHFYLYYRYSWKSLTLFLS